MRIDKINSFAFKSDENIFRPLDLTPWTPKELTEEIKQMNEWQSFIKDPRFDTFEKLRNEDTTNKPSIIIEYVDEIPIEKRINIICKEEQCLQPEQ